MLEIGNKIPEILGTDQDGKIHTAKDYHGKKLIIFFYPKASTPGCTAQACNLRDEYTYFLENNFAILGVSADEPLKQLRFKEKNTLPFPLIADTDKKLIEHFGVWGNKKFMGREFMGILRTTFIINTEGVIENIISKVKTKEHAQQIRNL